MRVVFLTQNSMASTVATRAVLNKHADVVVVVIFANQFSGESFFLRIKNVFKLCQKSGWRFFLYKALESKIYPLLLLWHRVFRTKRYLAGKAVSISEVARKHNIPCIWLDNLTSKESIQKLKEFGADWFFCQTAQILKKTTLEEMGWNFLNAHGSVLPRNRGPAQYIWHLLHQDRSYGSTLHFVSAGLDSGDILLQRQKNLPATLKSAYELHYRIAMECGEIFNDFIEQYSNDSFVKIKQEAKPQDHSQSTVLRLPKDSDMKALSRMGNFSVTLNDFFRFI